MVNDDSNYYSEEDSNSRTSPALFIASPCEDNASIPVKTRVISEDTRFLDSSLDSNVVKNDLLVLDASNLQYRGEGNSSLVIALKRVRFLLNITHIMSLLYLHYLTTVVKDKSLYANDYLVFFLSKQEEKVIRILKKGNEVMFLFLLLFFTSKYV